MDKKLLAKYLVRQGDSTLIMGQRLTEWCGHGPYLEEDIALSNFALDYIGQTQLYYDYAVKLNPELKSQDNITFFRDVPEYENFILTEMPNGDFAMTVLKIFLFSSFQKLWYQKVVDSADQGFAEIAAKALKETNYHFEHSKNWMMRLGDGTEESKKRMQDALDEYFNYALEFFIDDELEKELNSFEIIPLPSSLQPDWQLLIDAVLKEATLTKPEPRFMKVDAKQGRHTEHLGHILSELQFLQRAYPGNEW